jgi:2-polyprenyl-3-methyl-5-hydroxy-6-metoxy-1,4-benzoquinol methylase
LADPQAEALRRMEGASAYNTWLFERARPYLGRRVLDAGAGIGTFTTLAAEGREVVAVEPDPEQLAILRDRFDSHPDVQVAAGTIEDVDGTFDSILCLNVLEHIRDDRGMLARFHALLNPGGTLLLLVPAHPALYGGNDRVVQHERRYTKAVLRRRLEEAGLAIADLRYVNPVGAAGWLVSIRLLNREQVPEGPLKLYDKLVPALRALDKVDIGFGLSLWAVGRRS